VLERRSSLTLRIASAKAAMVSSGTKEGLAVAEAITGDVGDLRAGS
jgi:hypothetical protein